jgi:hypothetical protein
LIFQWLRHEELDHSEKLLLLLADLTYASERQIRVLTGWNHNQFNRTLAKARKKGSNRAAKMKWIRNERICYQDDRSCYSLGQLGLSYVAQRYQYPLTKENRFAHSAHSLGINDILIRLFEKMTNPKELEWYGTKEAVQVLYRMCRLQDESIQEKGLIRPDAFLIFQGERFWLEYDNETEGSKQLEEKMMEYHARLTPLSRSWKDRNGRIRKPIDQSPVIWVTNTVHRKSYLKSIWKQLIKFRLDGQQVPKMLFFVASEETDFFVKELSKR